MSHGIRLIRDLTPSIDVDPTFHRAVEVEARIDGWKPIGRMSDILRPIDPPSLSGLVNMIYDDILQGVRL